MKDLSKSIFADFPILLNKSAKKKGKLSDNFEIATNQGVLQVLSIG